jgi:hypothetical protein
MTTPNPRSRKVVRSLSWLSTRHDSTRSNIQVPDLFVDADAVGFNHQVRAVFCDEWQFSFSTDLAADARS